MPSKAESAGYPGWLATLKRANDQWGNIQAAATANNVDPAILAAIAIRESGVSNVVSGNGMAGYFQIFPGPNGFSGTKSVTDLTFAQPAQVAAKDLSLFMRRYADQGANGLAAALASCDGVSRKTIQGALGSSDPAGALDKATDRGNYISNILKLKECF